MTENERLLIGAVVGGALGYCLATIVMIWWMLRTPAPRKNKRRD